MRKTPAKKTRRADAAWSRNVDAKGRLTLGEAFANRTVIVEEHGEGEVLVRLARVVPESEAWLHANPEALAVVRAGLAQAKKGKVSKGPDMAKARRLAARLKDDDEG